jgi:predicted nucleic acid-binding Zn ribbon protein
VAGQLAPATPLAAVQRAWPGVVGAAAAREAEPVAERGGTVTVGCRSAVWAQELELMGPELVQRLNQAVGTPLLRGLRCVATGKGTTR